MEQTIVNNNQSAPSTELMKARLVMINQLSAAQECTERSIALNKMEFVKYLLQKFPDTGARINESEEYSEFLTKQQTNNGQ